MRRVTYIVDIDRVIVRATGVEHIDPSELRNSLIPALQGEMLTRGLPNPVGIRTSIEADVPSLRGGAVSLARVIASTVAEATSGGVTRG